MKRTYVRVALQMDSTWRVGAWDSPTADTQGTLTDAGGRPVAPGSGIAGSLRHAAGQAAEALFGSEPGAKELVASPWWVLGTVVEPGTKTTQRQRNRINRVRGAANERGLYRVEEVEPGRVLVYLRREHDSGNTDEEVIEPLLDLLTAWRPRIGGGASTGMGRARITEVAHRTLDLDDPADLRTLVCTGARPVERVDSLVDDQRAGAHHVPGPGLQQEHEPCLTATVTVDFLALPDAAADRIHGSSWKGLLRSRVEYIGRSLGHRVCGTGNGDWTGCGECAVCRAFGSSKRPGVWSFADSPFGPHEVEERQRIAIDRFTGGVRDGALWPQLYLRDVELGLRIDPTPSAAGSDPAPGDEWVRAALLHALRDLNDGLIGVGPEGAAGYGAARVSDVMFDGKPVDLGRLAPVPLPGEAPATRGESAAQEAAS